jgi:hypothetical protein
MALWDAELFRTRVVYIWYGTPGVTECKLTRMFRENHHKAGYLARFVA